MTTAFMDEAAASTAAASGVSTGAGVPRLSRYDAVGSTGIKTLRSESQPFSRTPAAGSA